MTSNYRTPALGPLSDHVNGCSRLVAGGECGKPATRHVIWAIGGGSSGSLVCEDDATYAAERYDTLDVHDAVDACDVRPGHEGGRWFPDDHTCRYARSQLERDRSKRVL